MALRKFIAPNFLIRSILPAGASSRFLNTRSIANVFRTASYFLRDSYRWAPIRAMNRALNSLESGVLRHGHFQGIWIVWQNTEALLLERYVSVIGKEEVKVFVERNNGNVILSSGSKDLITTEPDTLDQYGSCHVVNQPAILIIECKLAQTHEGKVVEGEFDTYTMWIDLQCDLYNTNAIKIKESNEVLEITIPKLKPEWIDKVGIKWEWYQRARVATVSWV